MTYRVIIGKEIGKLPKWFKIHYHKLLSREQAIKIIQFNPVSGRAFNDHLTCNLNKELYEDPRHRIALPHSHLTRPRQLTHFIAEIWAFSRLAIFIHYTAVFFVLIPALYYAFIWTDYAT